MRRAAARSRIYSTVPLFVRLQTFLNKFSGTSVSSLGMAIAPSARPCPEQLSGVLDRFLIDVCFQLQLTDDEKIYFFLKRRPSKSTSNCDPILNSTWLNFWASKIHQNPSKIDSKRGTTKLINFRIDRFLIDFGCALGANLEPCWQLFSARDRPRSLQDLSKTPPRRLQDGPRCIQKRLGTPKTAQDASKPALEPSRPRF